MTPATLDALNNPFIQAAIAERMGEPSIACSLEELRNHIADRTAERTAERVVAELRPLFGGQAGSWMTTPEAAAYLRIHAANLRKLAAEGAIDSTQNAPGGPRFYRREDLDSWRMSS